MAVKKTMDRALKSQKYLITISFKDSDSNNKDDLQHFWITKDYPKNSILPSLNHIAKEIIKKEKLAESFLKQPSLSNKNAG